MNVDNPYNLNLESTEAQAVSNGCVIAHIGVDPSEYRYDAEREAQIYSWYAAKSKAKVLHVWFKDGKLYACGAYNLGFPKMS